MIDLSHTPVLELTQTGTHEIGPVVTPLLVEREHIVLCFTSTFEAVVCTDRRLIVVAAKGLTGKKRDVTSLPYRTVQAFSVETAGELDVDAELELAFSGPGTLRLRFQGRADVRRLGQMIATSVL